MQRIASPSLLHCCGVWGAIIIDRDDDVDSPTTCETNDRWELRTREQTTKELGDLVGKQGSVPGEYALYADRIGGAARLAASGLQAGVRHPTRREMEGWCTYYEGIVYKVRQRRWGESSASVATGCYKAGGVQPDQGTVWGGRRVIPNYQGRWRYLVLGRWGERHENGLLRGGGKY